MKTRFDKLSKLANDTASLASRKLSSAQLVVSKAGTSTLAAGKSAQQAMGAAVETSGEFIRDAIDHEYSKAVTIKAKEIATTRTMKAKKLADGVVDATKGAEENHPPIGLASARDIENAIRNLTGRDRLGKLGGILGTTGGVAAGASAAGAIAGAAGVSTLLGSTTLASALGGVFVATTPVGWVIGSAALAGAAGYGIAKMIRSGSREDQVREELIRRLRQRLGSIGGKESEQVALDELRLRLPAAIKGGMVTEEQAERMVRLVEQGALNAGVALSRIKAISASQ